MVTTLNTISQITSFQGDFETALTYGKQSLTISQQIGDKLGEAAALNLISGHYWMQKNLGEVLI